MYAHIISSLPANLMSRLPLLIIIIRVYIIKPT